MSQNPWVLSLAPEELKDNDSIVLAAVTNDREGVALKYASERLRNSEKIVLLSVEECGASLEHASDRLKNNREIAEKAILSENPQTYRHTGPSIRKNVSLSKLALKINGMMLGWVDESILTFELVSVAVQQNGMALQYAKQFRCNMQICNLAEKQNPHSVSFKLGN